MPVNLSDENIGRLLTFNQSILITARQRSCEKVMFFGLVSLSVILSVCLFRGGFPSEQV